MSRLSRSKNIIKYNKVEFNDFDSMTIAYNVKTRQAVSMCVLLVFTTTIQLHMFGEKLMTDLFVHGVIQERAVLDKGW